MTNDQPTLSSDPRSAESAQECADIPSEINGPSLFPIVGVGASAGGLEAFTQLLTALPHDTGMAFVLVQHLAPNHPSALAEILSRATKMPVTEVHGEPTVEPNHVYIIPPGRTMTISNGALQLLPRETSGLHRPIDKFFISLAEEWQHQVIGVVLSGTASDGTIGLEAIKAEGGITFAQDATAQQEGMPHSAIASGCVDFVMAPIEIAQEIVRIGRQPFVFPTGKSRRIEDKPGFVQIVKLLHHATGVDFTHYKFNTLFRRVTRRMVLQKLSDLSQYIDFLEKMPNEVEALFQDILISVTSFFRDPDAFEVLKKVVFPRLLVGKTRHEPVRIWSPGCSTGQEVYSLAMVYAEAAEAAGSQAPLQIFATDVNADNIEKARAGVFSKDIAQEMSPERLRRFFTEVDGGYRITKAIRDACVFSRHNILTDSPFSRIDLISCRNLLIYLEPVLQQKIMSLLHYALKPAGVLWLGGSETIGSYRNLFEADDSRHRIYSRKPGTSTDRGHFALQHSGSPRAPFLPFATRTVDATVDLHKEADRVLLTKFAPPGVVVSADLEILQYRGDTGLFLTPAPGKASFSLLKMLREGLLVGVRAAIRRAGTEKSSIREEGLRVKTNEGHINVTIEVIPLRKGEEGNDAYLILFEQMSQVSRATSAPGRDEGEPNIVLELAPPDVPDSQLINADNVRLEQELVATRDYLQSLIEEQESVNEELQSANEEVQSANEELQSTNEELETSKEEIQSSNEELATVNDELHRRNTELTVVHNDLVNFVGSIQVAIVMLGIDLRIRRFTPSAEVLLNLTSGDVGRLLTDIQLNVVGRSDLEAMLKDVLDSLRINERDVQNKSGHWYSLRLRPYRTVDNVIDGIVVMLVDVDVMKRAHEYTASIVATVREPLLVLDHELRVQSASRSFYETFQVSSDKTLGRSLFQLGNGQWDIPELRRLLIEVLPLETNVTDFEMQHKFETIGQKSVRLNARRLIQTADQTPLIFLAIEDITERQMAQVALKDIEQRFHSKIDALPAAVYTTDANGRITYANLAAIELAGRIPDLQSNQWCLSRKMYHPDGTEWPHNECPMAMTLKTGVAVRDAEIIVERSDGTRRWVQPYPTPLLDAEGKVTGGINMLVDITERKTATAAIQVQHELLTVLSEAATALLFADSPDAMLHGLLAKIGPSLGIDVYFNYMADHAGDALRLVSCDGISAESARSIERLEYGQALCGSVASNRKSIVRTHLQQSDDSKAELARSFGFRAYACNPLLYDDLLLGTLSFASRSKDQFSADELTFLQTISDYVAVAYARIQAQDAMRENEERLRFIMDSMPQKVFTTTPSGHIDYFNTQWTEFTGMTYDEMYDSGWTQFVHPDDLPEKNRLWTHAFETGDPFQSEHRFRRADGVYRWHFSRATPLRDENGSILMWVGSNTDVDDIKQAEIALHESEVRYRRLFEASKDGVLILDFSNGRIIDVNPFMRELLGYSNDEFLGKELWEIGLFSDKAANESMVRELQEKGYVRFEHLPLKSKDGRSVEVEVVANAYQEDHHSVIQCNIRDITERSRMENVLRRQAVQLSEMHRRKDEFLAMLSHELRSPLAPIANAVQLLGLQKSSENRIQQQARGIIERQVGQLQHLVDDLLEVSRITSGRVQLRLEKVDVCRIAEGAVETVRPLIEQRRHELTVTLPQEPVWMVADAARLEQVLVNLLTNASKYTEGGGHIWLTVELSSDQASGGRQSPDLSPDSVSTINPATHIPRSPECLKEVVIRVQDTGVGISPALLPHIFDLFTQADRSLDRSQGGLGIGLALVKRLTELHGGTVEAFSTVGEGSEFLVRLPLVRHEVQDTSDELDPNSTIASRTLPPATPLKVLVVDDNVDTVLGFSMLLKASGHDVRTAHDGLSAVEAAIDYRPNVVLLDIGLPGLNGYEVAKRLRQHRDLKNTVLIALTGYGQDTDRQTSQQAGFEHHLVKPARFDQLKKILTTVQERLML